jgi:hypothetical protein
MASQWPLQWARLRFAKTAQADFSKPVYGFTTISGEKKDDHYT